MKTMVLFSIRCRRRNSSCICRRISGSSAEKGSSRNQSSGPTASERAMPTRCCWPPESWLREGFLAALEPHQRDHLAGPAHRVPLSAVPWTRSGKATLSSTVRCGSRPKCWNTMPMSLAAQFDQALASWRLEQVLRHRAGPRRSSARSAATGSAPASICRSPTDP